MNIRKKNKGFTLVELMVTVGIVGILAGIAYPSYQSNVLKSRHADAQAALMNLVNVMERKYTETNEYIGVVEQDTPYYDITITNPTNTTYLLQAIPIGSQSSDSCGVLSIDNLGNKLPAGCW